MHKSDDAPAEQIIIVRRRGGEEDHGHHGGAWKIAYADFMTAMMALFLVMWLINASNTETRASVAAYFSPIKLTDSVSRTRGMQDVVEKESYTNRSKAGGEAEAKDKADKKKPTEKRNDESAKGALENAVEEKQRLALTQDKAAPALKREELAARSGSASQSGRAFRDPFHPSMPEPVLSKDGNRASAGADRSVAATPGHSASPEAAGPMQGSIPAEPVAAETTQRAAEGSVAATTEGQGKSRPGAAPGGADAARQTEAEGRKLAATAARVLQTVQAAVRQLGSIGGPAIDVRVENRSIVISLTDTSTFGMFGIGSAEPNEDLVKLMRSITPVVTANGERLVVRGHTDGRQYRSDRNNNWRLSMLRAEAALALLVQSGVDESRIERIEAHADRSLKLPRSPEAAGNRRIEIVLGQAAR